MRVRTVIFTLSLALSGTYGCATLSVRPFRVGETAALRPGRPPAAFFFSAPVSSAPAPIPAILTLESEPWPAIEAEPSPSFDEIAPPSEEKPIEHQKERPTAVRLQDPPPTTLQGVRGPRADDELLDLVEKDLDRAFEQRAESRPLEFSKAVIENSKVRYFVNYFSGNGKSYFEKILARSGKYLPMISRVLREEGLPEELAYLALIESGFIANATSIHGAVGLWQFLPTTARQYGLRIDRWVDERRDPVKSTRAAAAYLKDLHDYFGRWYLATAAYNAGQGAIDRAMQRTGAKDFWSLSRKSQLSEETRNFVPKFVAVTLIATNLQKYGFTDILYERPLEYEEVEIETPLKLATVAELAGAEFASIRELNPALLRSATPPGDKKFWLKLPDGSGAKFTQALQGQKETSAAASAFVTHEVKKGETIFAIARRYGLGIRALMEFNGLADSRLRIGQKLKILLLDGLRGALR